MDSLAPHLRSAAPPRPSLRERLRGIAICVSFANLCFVYQWSKLSSRYLEYFHYPPVDPGYLMAKAAGVIGQTLLLALVFYLISRNAKLSAAPRAQWLIRTIFMVSLFYPFYVLQTESGLFGNKNWFAWVILAAWTVAVVRYHRQLFRPVCSTVLLLLTLLPLEVGTLALRVIRPAYVEPPLAGRLAAAPNRPRVLWVIFDELDDQWGFTNRPASVKMPEFDRLALESFSATQARRAARNTGVAIPALLTGKPLSKVAVRPPDDLALTFEAGRQTALFSSVPNIFSEARKLGFNSGIAGWYEPYCRLVANSVTSCVWSPGQSNILPDINRYGAWMVYLLRLQLYNLSRLAGLNSTAPTEPYGGRADRMNQIEEYETIASAASRAVADAGLDFVYLHWPVPHRFGIYDRRTERIVPSGTYFDNLQLADRTLGDLRSAMERVGLWDRTTVVVSADHSARAEIESGPFIENLAPPPESPVVPFFVKLAGQRQGMRYDAAFNACLTKDMLLAIMRGEVDTPTSLAAWLERNRQRIPLGR